MATFVLVHGAFHGGWCYSRVARLLRAQGHDVFTPTLTGLGERAHLSGVDVSLAVHVEDVAAVIRFEGLSDVILCGHSYGGMVITGVAALLGDRIRTLVYLDSFVSKDGQSLADIVGPQVAANALADPAGWAPFPGASFFNVNEADVAWVDARCTPHPLATFLDPIRLTGEERKVRHRVFIAAQNFDMAAIEAAYDRLSNDPAWRTARIESGHDLMIDAPEALAAALLAEVDL